MTAKLCVRDLPATERPIYRAETFGTGALNAGELLQIILGCATLDTSSALIARAGHLSGLINMTLEELTAIPDIGPTRAARIKAALELGRRAVLTSPNRSDSLLSPADAANHLLYMRTYEKEHLVVILLNTRNGHIGTETISIGSVNSAGVRIAEVFRPAIRRNAACIIVAHNHPSGDPSPSPEDVNVTRAIVEAGKLLDIDVLDHIIIGNPGWVSLKERGLGF